MLLPQVPDPTAFHCPVRRHIPLQAIGDRLLAQLEVQRWGECRGTLLGLLAAYNYEARASADYLPQLMMAQRGISYIKHATA